MLTHAQVDVATCDYIVDLDFPTHPIESAHQPRYAVDRATYDRAACVPFLDAAHSPLLTRVFWMPYAGWGARNVYGDYCLLRNRARVAGKVADVRAVIEARIGKLKM
jgi:alpha-1,2-mannosyltransferase